jgi:hypothetical protein
MQRPRLELGMILHTCNPSYSGGKDREDCDLRIGAKSYQDSILINKLGTVANPVIPST